MDLNTQIYKIWTWMLKLVTCIDMIVNPSIFFFQTHATIQGFML